MQCAYRRYRQRVPTSRISFGIMVALQIFQALDVQAEPSACSTSKVDSDQACTCSSSHVLKPVDGVSLWIYSDLKEKCCDAVCKEEVGTTCLLARMSSSNDRNVKSACGESSDSVSDFLSASGFQAASCSDTKDDTRQIVCMCSVVSADAVSPSCTAWAEDQACPAGYTGPDDSCAACPEGKFKPDVGSHACTDCPDNSNTDASGNPLTTDATGSDELSDCKCNTGFTGTLTTSSDCCANAAGGVDSCSNASNPPASTTTPTPTTPTPTTTPTPVGCEVGKFANVSGITTTCDLCPLGSTTASAGSVSVANCSCGAGWTGHAYLGQDCAECPSGTYKNTSGESVGGSRGSACCQQGRTRVGAGAGLGACETEWVRALCPLALG